MSRVQPLRVVAKALVIFCVLNLAFALANPPGGRLSLYGRLLQPRQRFPFAENAYWYDIDPGDLDAYFAVHAISSSPKTPDEYRVLVLGDSQTWGYPLSVGDTAVARLNDEHLTACGRNLKFYNLAYPRASVLKDFLILDRGIPYQPDMVVWMVTLYSFTGANSREPLFPVNALHSSEVLEKYGLERYAVRAGTPPTLVQRSIVAQRSWLRRLSLLQTYGLLWGATGIDVASVDYVPLPVDMAPDSKFGSLLPPELPMDRMTFDVLGAARSMAGNLPMLIVNEPIYVAPGRNSDVRYNSLYPRWAYDAYRKLLPKLVAQEGWNYVDLYDLVPYSEFTETELHISARGERMLGKALTPEILRTACP